MAKLTWEQAATFLGTTGEQKLRLIFKGDDSAAHPAFDAALESADGRARGRITLVYPAELWDALTSSTCPPYIQRNLLHLAVGDATALDDGRPDSYGNYAGIAAGWLDDVVSGKAKISELEPASSGDAGGRGGVSARVGAPRRASIVEGPEWRRRVWKL